MPKAESLVRREESGADGSPVRAGRTPGELSREFEPGRVSGPGA